jgi:hypothetical protein
MGVFGPKYPDPLQAAVNHAERLCAVLARLEGRHPDPRLWLVGRREEIELVLRLRIRDWKARRISLGFAARSIVRYLDDLHAGATSSLGLAANARLTCCADDEAPTLPLAGGQNVPRQAGMRRTPPPHAAETWFDLSALLDIVPPGGTGETTPQRLSESSARLPEMPKPCANKS